MLIYSRIITFIEVLPYPAHHEPSARAPAAVNGTLRAFSGAGGRDYGAERDEVGFTRQFEGRAWILRVRRGAHEPEGG